MIHFKNSMAFMMLLSVGTLLPAEQVSQFFGQAQTVGMDAWNSAQKYQIGQIVSKAFNDAQLWVNTNPKLTGALAASIVCGGLFFLWRKNFKKRVEKDLVEAWKNGYGAAQEERQGEYEDLLTEAVKEVVRAQEEGYNIGWNSAINQVCQMQEESICLQEQQYQEQQYKSAQQELDQFVADLCNLLQDEELAQEELISFSICSIAL